MHPLVFALLDVFGIASPGVAVAFGPRGRFPRARRRHQRRRLAHRLRRGPRRRRRAGGVKPCTASWKSRISPATPAGFRADSSRKHRSGQTTWPCVKVRTSRPWSTMPSGRGAARNPTSYRWVSKACTAGVHGSISPPCLTPLLLITTWYRSVRGTAPVHRSFPADDITPRISVIPPDGPLPDSVLSQTDDLLLRLLPMTSVSNPSAGQTSPLGCVITLAEAHCSPRPRGCSSEGGVAVSSDGQLPELPPVSAEPKVVRTKVAGAGQRSGTGTET